MNYFNFLMTTSQKRAVPMLQSQLLTRIIPLLTFLSLTACGPDFVVLQEIDKVEEKTLAVASFPATSIMIPGKGEFYESFRRTEFKESMSTIMTQEIISYLKKESRFKSVSLFNLSPFSYGFRPTNLLYKGEQKSFSAPLLSNRNLYAETGTDIVCFLTNIKVKEVAMNSGGPASDMTLYKTTYQLQWESDFLFYDTKTKKILYYGKIDGNRGRLYAMNLATWQELATEVVAEDLLLRGKFRKP